MKFVVTGALGHIGSYVVRGFARQFAGADIVMIDNLATQRFCSLFRLPTSARYRFFEVDVTDADLVPLIAGADVVLHLAAITDAAGSFDRAQQVEANNYVGTERVARACLETGARLIALSSTSVYGTQKALVSEECAPEDLKPQSPYATTKLREERLLQELAASAGLRVVCCRFGTIYGASPGMRFHTAVNKFCWQAAMGQPVTVWTTAFDQKRPYLDLADAARALEFIVRQDIFDSRIYNILTQNAAVRQIVETIQTFVPDLEVRFVDNPIMNQLSYEVSSERFCARGFTFSGDLSRGISETIAILRQADAARHAVAMPQLVDYR